MEHLQQVDFFDNETKQVILTKQMYHIPRKDDVVYLHDRPYKVLEVQWQILDFAMFVKIIIEH